MAAMVNGTDDESQALDGAWDPPVGESSLEIEAKQGVVTLYLHRPDTRNALDAAMVEELTAVARSLASRRDVRCVVLRGRGGFFSAGSDVRGLSNAEGLGEPSATDDAEEAVAQRHRHFGTLLDLLDRLPQALVAVVEGAALGSGFGLLTVADVVLARADARLGMPEARLGLVPAQIAPFVVRRIGLAASRRLLVTGRAIDGRQGAAIGLVDHCCEAAADLEAALATTLRDVLRCGPRAVADGKALLHAASEAQHGDLLAEGARVFAHRLRSAEAREGIAAFLERRPASWVEEPRD